MQHSIGATPCAALLFTIVACSERPRSETGDPDAGTTHAATTGGGGHGAGGAPSDGGVDAGRDAGAPTVVVTPDCVGVADVTVELSTTEDNEFLIDGRVGFSMALSVDDVVRFSTATDHNFESVPGTPSEFFFKSGEPGAHIACLRFTAPTPRPVGYECDPHAGDGMVGTLTVE